MSRGKFELTRHRPHAALLLFREALDSTPADRQDLIAQGMYWIAISLFRLGKTELAIHALASAQRIGRRGLARKLYLSWVNGYGMIRRPNAELDDLYAYSSLQIGSFLARKKGRRFESMDEHDMVMRLVFDAWKSLCRSGRMDGKSCGEKLELFSAWKPTFPTFRRRSDGGSGAATILTGRFGASACTDRDVRCRCGSGLPYCMCCGRIPGLRELSGE
jgi:hypothetical protein